MIVQARWVDPTVTDQNAMLAASRLIAKADVENGAAANVWLADVAAQHAADCPPGWVPVVCIAGSPWFDPAVG